MPSIIRSFFSCLLVVSGFMLVGCSRTNPDVALARAFDAAKGGDESPGGKESDFEAALVLLRDAVEIESPAVEALELKMLCLVKLDRYTDALEVAADLQKVAPKSFLNNYLAGKIYYDQQNYADAFRFLNRAREISKELNINDYNTELLHALAAARADDKDASLYADMAIPITSGKDQSILCNEIALWAVRQGKPAKALAYLSRGVEGSDPSIELYRNMAVIYDEHMNMPLGAHRAYMRYQKVAQESGITLPDKELKAVQDRMRAMQAQL